MFTNDSIKKYAVRFSQLSDEELFSALKSENKCRGWVSERSYYLLALRNECVKRGKSDWLFSPDSVFHRVVFLENYFTEVI